MTKQQKREYDLQYRQRPGRRVKERELRRAWRKRNLQTNNQYVREWAIKKNYGITASELQHMLEKQEFRCAICRKPQIQLVRKLAIDHNHNTGKVRGLLCGQCNRGIGWLNDDVKLLEAAVMYLRNYS